jgi:hypothetical protein
MIYSNKSAAAYSNLLSSPYDDSAVNHYSGGEFNMAKKKQDGGVNKSEAIRVLLKEKPDIKGSDAITELAAKGIDVKPSLFYLVKGKVSGRKRRRRKNRQNAMAVMTNGSAGATASLTKSDALSTIRKVKTLAAEVGGLRTLKALVYALSE